MDQTTLMPINELTTSAVSANADSKVDECMEIHLGQRARSLGHPPSLPSPVLSDQYVWFAVDE